LSLAPAVADSDHLTAAGGVADPVAGCCGGRQRSPASLSRRRAGVQRADLTTCPARLTPLLDTISTLLSDHAGALCVAPRREAERRGLRPAVIEVIELALRLRLPARRAVGDEQGHGDLSRRIAGRYAALSRWDRESNAIGYSAGGRPWSEAITVQTPTRPWELIQLGNCGSPIETLAGWNVVYSCGPMIHGNNIVLPYGCSD
jgi:hypothetical protein